MSAQLKPPGFWTDYEDRQVRLGARENQSAKEIAAHLNRQEKSVRTRALILKCFVR